MIQEAGAVTAETRELYNNGRSRSYDRRVNE